MNTGVSEKVELFLCCRNLRDLDVFSKSDPYIKVLYKRDFTQKQYAVIGIFIFIKVAHKPNKTNSIPLSTSHSNWNSSSSQGKTFASISSTMTDKAIMTTTSALFKPRLGH
jgi:hypothetical protein